MTETPNARLLDCGWCYEEQGEEVHPHPECPIGRTAPPARYRRRTQEVEAVQWTGRNAEQLRAFCGPDFDTIDPEDRIEDLEQDAQVLVQASHWTGMGPGDWVLKFEDHFDIESDEGFRAAWEAVSSAVAAPADQAAPLHVFRVSEIRDNTVRRVHGYHASLQGAFAYCEAQEREAPLVDGARFELFPAPGGEQWLIHGFYGPDDPCPEISDLVITRVAVIPDDAPPAAVLPADSGRADTPAAECSAQYHGPGEEQARHCIRAAQHTGKDHVDEHGFHWSDTVAMYPLADSTFRTGINLRAELRRMAAEPAAGAPHTTEPDSGRVVAYRSPHGLYLYCTRDAAENGVEASWTPVSSDDLPDGGLCCKCHVDVLIPQPAAGLPAGGTPETCTNCRGSGLDPRYSTGGFDCPDCTTAGGTPHDEEA